MLPLDQPLEYISPPRGLPRFNNGVSPEQKFGDAVDPHQVSTVGVELSSPVAGLDVDSCLVNEADDLEVVGGADELHALDSTLGDEARAMARLRAPRD